MCPPASDPDHPLLFVYGTLMSQAESAMAKLLSRHASKISHATFRGKMFRVNRPDGTLIYPAVISSDLKTDQVHGELFQLNSSSILHDLDEYESCGPNSQKPHEYSRELCQINLPDHTMVEAYIYLYCRPTAHLSPIPSGSFLDS